MERVSIKGQDKGSMPSVSKTNRGVRSPAGGSKFVSRSRGDAGSQHSRKQTIHGGPPQSKPSGSVKYQPTSSKVATVATGNKKGYKTASVKSNAQVKASQKQNQTNVQRADVFHPQLPRPSDTPAVKSSKAAFNRMSGRGSY